jgi:hypothetical protein
MRQALLAPVLVLVFALAALLAAGAAPAMAQIPSAKVTPAIGIARDFTIVKRAGVYHIFHILQIDGNDQNYLAHLTSTNLYSWTPQPNVLVGTQAQFPKVPDGRNGWNRDWVWSPSIVERAGVYYMFYTGVRRRSGCPGQAYQKIGVAISTDLFHWNLALDPWLTPEKLPWAMQGDTCTYNYGNFRDPFVMQDPATGEWLMFFATIPNAAAVSANVACDGSCVTCGYSDVRYVVGAAHAPADFDTASDWTNLGALWNTYQTWPGGGCYRTWESPHVFSHTAGGHTWWFLYATAGTGLWGSEVVFSQNGVSPAAPPASWQFKGPMQNQYIRDPHGNLLSTEGWYATEYFRDPDDGREYFANCGPGYIEIRQMLWIPNTTKFQLSEPFHITSVVADKRVAIAGTTVNITLEGRDCVDGVAPRQVPLRALKVDAAGNPVAAIPLDALGLPHSVVLTGDQTSFSWVAASLPSDSMTRVVIGLADTTTGMSTLPISVYPVDYGQPIDVADVPRDSLPVREPSLRALGATPLGPGFGLLIDLPAAMGARLDVFDLNGRVVRQLAHRELPAGATIERWDLRDDSGRRVTPGVYYARLVTSRGAHSVRLVTLSPR